MVLGQLAYWPYSTNGLGNGECLVDFHGTPAAGAPVHDEAGVDQVRHGAHHLWSRKGDWLNLYLFLTSDSLLTFHGTVWVVLVNEHEIDVIQLEIAQGTFHRFYDFFPGEPSSILAPRTWREWSCCVHVMIITTLYSIILTPDVYFLPPPHLIDLSCTKSSNFRRFFY